MALTKVQAAGLTADLIDETKLADNSIDSEHYNDGSIDNEHLADDAVGIAELSATGTASSSTFLRGDNSWQTVSSDVVSDTSPQLGGSLDVQTHSIISGTTNESIRIVPNGTGSVFLNAHQVVVGDVAADTAKEIISTGTGTFSIKSESGNSDISIIPHGTGDVTLDTDTVRVGDSNADVAITTNGTGDLTLSTNAGTNSGTIEIEDGANNDIVVTPNGSGDVIIDGLKYPQADGSADQVLKTNGSGQLSWTTPASGAGGATGTDYNDGVKVRFGDAPDVEHYWDNSASKYFVKCASQTIQTESTWNYVRADNFSIYKSDGTETVAKFLADGACELYYNNSKKLETTTGGVRYGDNVNIELGTDNDLQLYHSGSHGTLNCSTGFMHILGAYVRINSPGGDKMIEAIADNTVNIMYDNAIKINTTSSGCTVTGSVSETSDAALKNNIQQLTNSLSNIKQLKGYSYEFKDTGVKSIGCTTQDVEKVYPDLVEGEEGTKTLQYSGLIGPLIEAVKELSAEVETLKTKVAALEAG